jgi:hypothetical protein
MPAPIVVPRLSYFAVTLAGDWKISVAEFIYFIGDPAVENYILCGSETSDEQCDDTNTHVELCCDGFGYSTRLQDFRSIEVNASRYGLYLQAMGLAELYTQHIKG